MERQVYKAWFPYDGPDHPSRLKKFQDDPDNWDDRWFLCERPGASTTRDTGCHQRCLWVTQQNFCVSFTNKPNIHVMMDFKWRANVELCYLLFLSILGHQHQLEVSSTKIQYHVQNLMKQTFSLVNKQHPYVMCTFLINFDFSGIQAEYIHN